MPQSKCVSGSATKNLSLAEQPNDRESLQREVEELRAELERSQRDLARFASLASHELLEPLRMVSSFTTLLATRYADQLDDKGHQYIHFAQDGAQRLRAQIQGLLLYSRIGTRGRDLLPVPLTDCLDTALRAAEADLSPLTLEVGQSAEVMVVADAHQIALMFEHLLSNAVKFRRGDAARVEVAAESSGDMVEVVVRDDGIGVDPEHADRIFDVFERLHGRDAHPGIGIGLALCKRISERHGGRTWVESDGSSGCAFHFTLKAGR